MSWKSGSLIMSLAIEAASACGGRVIFGILTKRVETMKRMESGIRGRLISVHSGIGRSEKSPD